MTLWKLPPRAKVFEALSAVADGRVRLIDTHTAVVLSSDRTKSYQVTWSDGMHRITSNDNASYWRGYMGYPIIAVLLQTGRIPIAPDLAAPLASVPWKQLNTTYRRDYEAAIQYVLDHIVRPTGADTNKIASHVDGILEALQQLRLERLPGGPPPPPDPPRP